MAAAPPALPIPVIMPEPLPMVVVLLEVKVVKAPEPAVVPPTATKLATPTPVTDHWASAKTRSPVEALPIVMVPPLVPVPILVALDPEALILVVPRIVSPPVPWISPDPELTPTNTAAPAVSIVLTKVVP